MAYDPDAHVYDVAEIDVEKIVFIQIILWLRQDATIPVKHFD